MSSFGPFGMEYRGDAEFGRLLSDLKCCVPLHQVKTLLLGCVAATHVPRLNDIIPAMWGGKAPTFKTVEQARAFTADYMGLWNRLAAHHDGAPYRLAPVDCSADKAGIARYATVRLEEIAGFVRGLDLGGTDPKRMSAKARDALRALAEGTALLEVCKGACTKDPEPAGETLRQLLANLRQMDGVLEGKMAEVLAEQFSQRTRRRRAGRPAAPSNPTPPAPRPGRNEPCPCGSGRKYRQCCGKGQRRKGDPPRTPRLS